MNLRAITVAVIVGVPVACLARAAATLASTSLGRPAAVTIAVVTLLAGLALVAFYLEFGRSWAPAGAERLRAAARVGAVGALAPVVLAAWRAAQVVGGGGIGEPGSGVPAADAGPLLGAAGALATAVAPLLGSAAAAWFFYVFHRQAGDIGMSAPLRGGIRAALAGWVALTLIHAVVVANLVIGGHSAPIPAALALPLFGAATAAVTAFFVVFRRAGTPTAVPPSRTS